MNFTRSALLVFFVLSALNFTFPPRVGMAFPDHVARSSERKFYFSSRRRLIRDRQRLVRLLSFHRHFPLALARSETLQIAEGKHLDRGPSLTRDLRLKGGAQQPRNGTPLGTKYQLPENSKSSSNPNKSHRNRKLHSSIDTGRLASR
jgi:hypothetical protein